jgi:hypothetical protein
LLVSLDRESARLRPSGAGFRDVQIIAHRSLRTADRRKSSVRETNGFPESYPSENHRALRS